MDRGARLGSPTTSDITESLQFTWFDGSTPLPREELIALWIDVTNAGGAVGFIPPVSFEDVLPLATKTFDRVDAGSDALLVGAHDGGLVGWLVLERDDRAHASHWRTLKRFQVRPSLQGRGMGGRFLAESRRYARDVLGLEFLLLTVRDGTGAGRFYERSGYREVGRIPAALRVAPGDDRDEVTMTLVLGDRPGRDA